MTSVRFNNHIQFMTGRQGRTCGLHQQLFTGPTSFPSQLT